MARRMLKRSELPSAANAFKGMILAPGATKCTSPAVMVPWPKALGGPSRMLVIDWLRIAMVDGFSCTRICPSRMLVEDCDKAAAIPGGRSLNSEGDNAALMKLTPGTRLGASAG